MKRERNEYAPPEKSIVNGTEQIANRKYGGSNEVSMAIAPRLCNPLPHVIRLSNSVGSFKSLTTMNRKCGYYMLLRTTKEQLRTI